MTRTTAEPKIKLSKWRRVRRFLFSLAAALLAFVGGYWLWFTHRALPASVDKDLFDGVHYRREIRNSPRPLVIHVVTVDLTNPNVSFLVTPGNPNALMPLKAQTTSQFRENYGVQIAVNGDYFFPYHSHTILDYYPHVGDPVEVEGVSASRGVAYGEKSAIKQDFPTLYISRDNQAEFAAPKGRRPTRNVYNAISGLVMLLRNGINVAPRPEHDALEPCAALALNRERTKLYIVMTDGRQPNYSEGTTLWEFAEIIRGFGGYNALDLDGGGSEALVTQAKNGKTLVLNAPLDAHIPGRERAVANHFGVFAKPLKSGGAFRIEERSAPR